MSTENATRTAVVLVGGRGTRLRSVVSDVPKPLAPVAGKPFLDHLLRFLAQNGIVDVILAAGYQADDFDPYQARANDFGLQTLAISKEPETLLGTGGALGLLRDRLKDRQFLVVNGDTYFQADLRALLTLRLDAATAGCLGLCRVHDRARFGSVETDAGGVVRQFLEKGETGPGWVSAGIGVYDGRVFDRLPVGQVVSLERDVQTAMLKERSLRALKLEGAFFDIGIPTSYHRFVLDTIAQDLRVEAGAAAVDLLMTWVRSGRVYAPAGWPTNAALKTLLSSRSFLREGPAPLATLGPDDAIVAEGGESLLTTAKHVELEQVAAAPMQTALVKALGFAEKLPPSCDFFFEETYPVAFLDRDGVVIEYKPYIDDPAHVTLRAGAVDLIATLHRRGYRVVLVTNQSGVGREKSSMPTFWDVQRKTHELLAAAGQWLDAVYFSTFYEKSNRSGFLIAPSLRKPNVGALAWDSYWCPVDREKSIFVGDNASDVECARRFGLKTYFLVESGIEEESRRSYADAMAQARRAKSLADLTATLSK